MRKVTKNSENCKDFDGVLHCGAADAGCRMPPAKGRRMEQNGPPTLSGSLGRVSGGTPIELRWDSGGAPVVGGWKQDGALALPGRSLAGQRTAGTLEQRTAGKPEAGTPGKNLMRAGIFAFAFSYLCSRNKNCKDGNGKRVSNRGEQPLRGVVALQRGTHVRLFRPGRQPHRIHDGRVARGRRGEQPHDAPPPA